MTTPLMGKSQNLIVVITVLLAATVGACHGTLVGRELVLDSGQLIGDWTGESICQVKGSPCHDEKVVYHISNGNEPNHLTINADKIVDGKAIDMGKGDYTYDRKAGTLVNESQGRVWKFTVEGNRMTGTLTMPDGTIYRRVNVKKEEK